MTYYQTFQPTYNSVGPENQGLGTLGLDVPRAVRLNRRYSVKLGWDRQRDLIDRLLGFTNFTPGEELFAESVASWQSTHGLADDGIIGPKTWARMRPLVVTNGAPGRAPVLPFLLPVPRFRVSPDPYQRYVGQSICDNTPRPGVVEFRDLVLRVFPGTRDLGIRRGCARGGRSEHKEGRAWDWGVNVSSPTERVAAEALIGWLTAPREGHSHAFARRLGLMYMVWNRRIWKAYRSKGKPPGSWHPYHGSSPHTDHVHFSFGWDGALRRTSWWTGRV